MAKTAAALVVAAGRGSRLATNDNRHPKQYRLLAGRPVLTHTLIALANHPRISKVVTVIHPEDKDLYAKACSALHSDDLLKLADPVVGGATRQQSVLEGLKALAGLGIDYVLIHDAARPFVTSDVIDRLIASLESGAEGALAAVEVTDTMKKKPGTAGPLETIDRTGLWAAQTPQAFPLEKILSAHQKAAQKGLND
ncbi:MAG: 2-C-methyl-D-erythritol 4-phosphate cytidylyltransferase, partial [Roseibium sp.]|uniref:2-C-methyl-D-erythritol 4-phosphate cytidylyltransferase n=1 Tax=Roseibium sp. TaxID=1936156 RepID=UPI0026017A89